MIGTYESSSATRPRPMRSTSFGESRLYLSATPSSNGYSLNAYLTFQKSKSGQRQKWSYRGKLKTLSQLWKLLELVEQLSPGITSSSSSMILLERRQVNPQM